MNGKFAALLLLCGSIQAFAQGSGASSLLLIDKNKAAGVPATAGAPGAALDHSVLIQRYGTVLDRRPIGAGGLTAWTVEKNGRRVVLYTTADGQAVISGVVWETLSGRNLSDQFVGGVPNVKGPLGASNAPALQERAMAQVGQGAALVGKFSGAIPESIKTVDSLAGIKEGKAGQADTLYVIFDPRCPYCRKAYTFTREYVKRGFSIKWIPAVVLGNDQQGNALSATILQAKPDQQLEALRRVLGNKEEIATAPNKETLEALGRNAAFFFAAFQNNKVDQAGVPAAFFLDKRTGQPRMMTGISEMPVIEEVFGKL